MTYGYELMMVANFEVLNVWPLQAVISANSSYESKERGNEFALLGFVVCVKCDDYRLDCSTTCYIFI